MLLQWLILVREVYVETFEELQAPATSTKVRHAVER